VSRVSCVHEAQSMNVGSFSDADRNRPSSLNTGGHEREEAHAR
jgi:hypothetical protein